jgi:hypothetical protein
VVARWFVRLELRRNSVGEEVGAQFVDVSLLVQCDGVVVEAKLDTEQVVQVALVFYLPSVLEFGDEIVVEGGFVVTVVEHA